jgi:methylated-DNA-protein-cysteine methyltransferase-like protein
MTDDLLSFNEKVYALVRHIPPGRLLTYGRIAALLETPRGARAVGWAMHGAGSSPATADIPWQRVVSSAGRISTKHHTADEQKRLLEAEGVRFDERDSLKILRFNAILWIPSPLEVRDILVGPGQ